MKKTIYHCGDCKREVSLQDKFCCSCGGQLMDATKEYYVVEYYDVQGGHGELNSHPTYEQALAEGKKMFAQEKKDKQLGTSTGYIGVGGNGKKFAIVYMDKAYPNADGTGITGAADKKIWIEASKKAIATGKLVEAEWSGQTNDGMDLQEFEKHINENEKEIRQNMKTYGYKSPKEIGKIRNYIDLANVLNIDSRDLRDVELSTYAATAAELLSQS